MNLGSNDYWYTANSRYLTTAAVAVHRALEHYLARQQNQAIDAFPDEQSTLTAIAAEMSAPPALEQLCTTFSLSPFERNILLMGVGMALLPGFPSMCANAHGNREMAYPTFGLALEVFPNTHWSALTPQAPLRHWQLLQVGTGASLPLCPLQIDESILHYVLGESYQDQHLLGVMKSIQTHSQTQLQPSHQLIAERLAASWLKSRGIEEKSPSQIPIIQLCGSEVSAKWEITVAACAMMGYPLKVMSARRLPTNPQDLYQLMRRWEREVALTGCILLLDCEQTNFVEPLQELAIVQLIEDTNTPLIIATPERLPPSQRPLITFDVPKLTHSEQRAIWKSSLGKAAELDGYVEELVSQFNLSTAAIGAACLELQSMEQISQGLEENSLSKIQDSKSKILTQLWQICRTMARPRLDDLAQRIDSTATWDDLVLPEAQAQILRALASHVRQRTKVYEQWGFAGKGKRGLGISALFAGASGTGKTMAAEVVARELQLDLYRIDLSAVVSKYIGETEKNLRRIFDAAEAGGAVLLFDEADALFGKRTQVKDSHDRHANVEVSYLLQRMEAYQGLAILTTNLKDSLDSAFLRRIRFIVKFLFPDPPQREEIWRHIFPSQTPTDSLDVNKLAKLSVAGGNIRNIALNAAFLAADAGEPVKMKHILESAKSEYVKLEKSLTETEVKGWV